MFKFPFSKLHELNLDWILGIVKNLVENNEEFNRKADYAVETADEAKTIAEQAAQATIPDGAVTTIKLADGAVTEQKLDVTLAGKINDADDFISTASAGRANVVTYRWHIDCVNGDDDDTGDNGHPWKTLDKFFSMANQLNDGGKADLRCYLDTAGTYQVGSLAQSHLTYTGLSFHITGGLDSSAPYDGNYIIQFLNTGETKFYVCHSNFKNLRFEFPNSTTAVKFSFDGGNFSVGNCYINAPLDVYGTLGTVQDTTVQNVTVNCSNVLFLRVKTLSTSTNQYILNNNSTILYSGSISGGNLLVNSTFTAFDITNSTLMLGANYPSSGMPTSIDATNSVIMCPSSRVVEWKKQAGTIANSIWLTDEEPQVYTPGDSYTTTKAILPAVLTASAKKIRIGVPMPKNIIATSATVSALTGGIRVSAGGYVSDGSEASGNSDWINGDNITSVTTEISGNFITIIVTCTAVPTVGGNNLTNNSTLTFEGTITMTFA